MHCTRKLFRTRNPYDVPGTDPLFVEAVRENIRFHTENCPGYRAILEREAFAVEMLQTAEDLFRIPVLPTLFLKAHPLFSMEEKRFLIRATSSGTSGMKSRMGIDYTSFSYGLRMMLSVFSYHRLLSPLPTNYIVLNYQPSPAIETGAVKTAHGATYFAPPVQREYALKYTGETYVSNLEGISRALWRYQKQGLPVRFVGFPYFMLLLTQSLKENGMRLRLNRHSRVLLGGGFKQHASKRVEKEELYARIGETLSIKEAACKEFFSAAEHPVAYCDCMRHHFHVPVYSRVIIRNTKTLQPLGYDAPGLLSFVTPIMQSVPFVSVMTDDIAVLREGKRCGCGITAPYFELLGRANAQGIQTCAAGAAQAIGG